mmetsp:Transcript_17287/g.47611  ORF Transcript_17287/g.47611 Transcript_17287/m.47611 type:complete len:97 (+) Transcript_17287:3796-4086(+)
MALAVGASFLPRSSTFSSCYPSPTQRLDEVVEDDDFSYGFSSCRCVGNVTKPCSALCSRLGSGNRSVTTYDINVHNDATNTVTGTPNDHSPITDAI